MNPCIRSQHRFALLRAAHSSVNFRASCRLLLVLAGLLTYSPCAEAKNARYNSINELPRNLYLADVDGDTEMEFVQFGKNRVFSFEADFDHSGRFHYYSRSEFKKVIVGAFRETEHSEGRDEICFMNTDNRLECFTVFARWKRSLVVV